MRRKIVVSLGLALAFGFLGVIMFGSALAQPLWKAGHVPTAAQQDPSASCHVGGNQDGQMFGPIAQAFGMTESDLWAEIQSGKSMRDIAKARGWDEQKLAALLNGAMQEHLEKHVAEGHLSQADADAMNKHMGQVGFEHMSGISGADTQEEMMKGMMGGYIPSATEQQSADPTQEDGGSCHGGEQNTSRTF